MGKVPLEKLTKLCRITGIEMLESYFSAPTSRAIYPFTREGVKYKCHQPKLTRPKDLYIEVNLFATSTQSRPKWTTQKLERSVLSN